MYYDYTTCLYLRSKTKIIGNYSEHPEKLQYLWHELFWELNETSNKYEVATTNSIVKSYDCHYFL